MIQPAIIPSYGDSDSNKEEHSLVNLDEPPLLDSMQEDSSPRSFRALPTASPCPDVLSPHSSGNSSIPTSSDVLDTSIRNPDGRPTRDCNPPAYLKIMCATKLKCSPITHHRVLSLPQVLPVLFLIFFLVIIYPLLVVSSCRQSCLMMSPNILRRLSNMTIGEQQCPKSFGHLRPTKLGHYNLCLPRRNQLVVSGFTR